MYGKTIKNVHKVPVAKWGDKREKKVVYSGSKVKERGFNRLFALVNGTLLFLFLLVELYPMIYVVSASVSNPRAVASGEMMLFPVGFSLKGYEMIFQYKDIWWGYANTIFYTVAGTLFNLLLTLPAAYALSRKDFKDKHIVMIYFMITMYISGGLIPQYLNMRSMGLVGNRAVMIISSGLSVYNMIVARTFFASSIPWELHEAARIDGATNFKMLTSIVAPLSKPIIAVMSLYYGVGHWNAYFSAMIYLGSNENRHKWPLQMILREILFASEWTSRLMDNNEGEIDMEMVTLMLEKAETSDMLKYGIIVVSTLPMLLIYPRLQKYFNKGIMIGSVKG